MVVFIEEHRTKGKTMQAPTVNIIDTMDMAADEFMAGGGTVSEWLALDEVERFDREVELIASTVEAGYWFRWSDGTVRDWPMDYVEAQAAQNVLAWAVAVRGGVY